MSIVISGNKNLKFIKAVYYQPVIPPPPQEKYLTIEALEDGFYISYTDCYYEVGYTEEEIQQLCNETGWEYEKMQYSFDKINWYILEPYEPTPSINTGEKIYLKRRFIAPGLFDMVNNALTNIFCDYQYNLSGNCNSILFGDGDGELFDGCFYQLFGYNSGLINISESFLPATTLAYYCYANMFAYCNSLVSAPALPATTLADYCYANMFYNASLVTAPTLPATTLTKGCYISMFINCTKLNYIKALFTTTPSSTYTSGWVTGVSSTGTFVKNSAATWNVTGVNGIPSGWTIQTA